jgi:hypothetical protein
MNILHYFLIYTAQGSTAPDQGGFYSKVPLLSTLMVPEPNQFVWTRGSFTGWSLGFQDIQNILPEFSCFSTHFPQKGFFAFTHKYTYWPIALRRSSVVFIGIPILQRIPHLLLHRFSQLFQYMQGLLVKLQPTRTHGCTAQSQGSLV